MKHKLNMINAIPMKCTIIGILNFISTIYDNVWQHAALSGALFVNH